MPAGDSAGTISFNRMFLQSNGGETGGAGIGNCAEGDAGCGLLRRPDIFTLTILSVFFKKTKHTVGRLK